MPGHTTAQSAAHGLATGEERNEVGASGELWMHNRAPDYRVLQTPLRARSARLSVCRPVARDSHRIHQAIGDAAVPVARSLGYLDAGPPGGIGFDLASLAVLVGRQTRKSRRWNRLAVRAPAELRAAAVG